MTKLSLVLIGSILTLCFTIGAMAYNPCNVGGDCSHSQAEKLLVVVQQNIAALQIINEAIELSEVQLSQADKDYLKIQASEIHSRSEEIYKNFVALLNIQERAEANLVARRYSAQLWNVYEASGRQKNIILDKILRYNTKWNHTKGSSAAFLASKDN